ncbi:MAG TPA: hypothetical protein VFG72_04585 [Marmoricola sp.]|nr:hypothetical protein [Marmoricola sp.]
MEGCPPALGGADRQRYVPIGEADGYFHPFVGPGKHYGISNVKFSYTPTAAD